MVKRLQNRGFSLAEVMMATGILAIGFVFIASVFPVGVKLTAVATEQTIAPIVADEAFAKMKLYADPNFVPYLSPVEYRDFSDVAFFGGFVIPDDEFGYPSTDISPERKKYHWSALCGLLLSGDVHVTVFVTRISGAGTRFLTHESDYTLPIYGQAVLDPDKDDRPVPVKVGVEKVASKKLKIVDALVDVDERGFINGGSTIVDDATGQIYRVLGRGMNGDPENVIVLDRAVLPTPVFVWIVPPAVTSDGPPIRVGGRNPCIGIYQRVVSF